jgi:hypothetical protein
MKENSPNVLHLRFLPDEPECEDEKWECPVWAHNGDCIRHPEYMKRYCKTSCMLCGEGQFPLLYPWVSCDVIYLSGEGAGQL